MVTFLTIILVTIVVYQ